MYRRWLHYVEMEDDDEFIAEEMVYEELAVEFYNAKHGMEELLKAPMAPASTSPGTVSTTTTDSDPGSSPVASVLLTATPTMSPSVVEASIT
jgi:hypothetical protein